MNVLGWQATKDDLILAVIAIVPLSMVCIAGGLQYPGWYMWLTLPVFGSLGIGSFPIPSKYPKARAIWVSFVIAWAIGLAVTATTL